MYFARLEQEEVREAPWGAIFKETFIFWFMWGQF